MISNEVREATERLTELSLWIDAGNAGRDPEAITWGRLAKISEEDGEVISAFIGATGQNPRKGVVGSMADVKAELLDVAITALGAYEHIDGHQGNALTALFTKINSVYYRAVDNGLVKLGRSAKIQDHHTRLHGFCIHGELRGECDKGGY